MATDNYCDGCGHYRPITGYSQCNKSCHYILDVGHSRGCPPGDGCKCFTGEKVSTEDAIQAHIRGDYIQGKDW